MTKVLLTTSYLASSSARTIDVKTILSNYADLTADNFYCEVVGLTGNHVSTAAASSGTDLIPTYDSSTGIVSIPKLYKGWTYSGAQHNAYVSYKVYAIY